MQRLGRLIRMDAREVWTHEAHDFTPWLHDHIGLLADAIGFDLEATGREVAVGDFAVDVVGQTVPDGRSVIVENQLAQTDHSHLGQLLTYASGLDAAVIVWLSSHFRDEHRQVLDWLNGHTTDDVDFFGVELELLRIDDSPPAPHFKLVAQPNEWTKSSRDPVSNEPTELRLRYHAYFSAVLAAFKEQRPHVTSTSRVGHESWLGFAAGKTSFAFNWAVGGRSRARVELYIDTGDGDANKAYFDALQARAAEIEAALGLEVTWERLDQRRASRLSVYHSIPSSPPIDQNLELQAWAADTMVRWNDVLRPIIRELEFPAVPG